MRRTPALGGKLVGAVSSTTTGVEKAVPKLLAPSPLPTTTEGRLPPPVGWESLYGAVVQARRKIVAPVDTIGCSQLQKPSDSVEDQRYQTLISLMLSSQTKDQMTAKAMANLHEFGCTPRNIDRLSVSSLKDKIAMVGFANKKAEYIKNTTASILADHDGVIPSTAQELCKFTGVGPKMAHLFVQCADGTVEGIGVDTHVHRIADRFKWVKEVDTSLMAKHSKSAKGGLTPEDTRKTLEKWLPKQHWATVNEVLVGWGQTVCLPRFPKCHECPVAKLCPAAFSEESETQRKKRLKSSSATSSRENSVTAGSPSQPKEEAEKALGVVDMEDLVVEDDIAVVKRVASRKVSGRSRVVGVKDTTTACATIDNTGSPARKKARREEATPKTKVARM